MREQAGQASGGRGRPLCEGVDEKRHVGLKLQGSQYGAARSGGAVVVGSVWALARHPFRAAAIGQCAFHSIIGL